MGKINFKIHLLHLYNVHLFANICVKIQIENTFKFFSYNLSFIHVIRTMDNFNCFHHKISDYMCWLYWLHVVQFSFSSLSSSFMAYFPFVEYWYYCIWSRSLWRKSGPPKELWYTGCWPFLTFTSLIIFFRKWSISRLQYNKVI